jgi:hypothetical protein
MVSDLATRLTLLSNRLPMLTRGTLLITHLQAPKEQKSKEAKAIAAANSSKGKKKVRMHRRRGEIF